MSSSLVFRIISALAVAAAAVVILGPAVADAKSRRYFVIALCSQDFGCADEMFSIPAGKRLQIRDASCNARVTNAGIASQMSVHIVKNGDIKSVIHLAPQFGGIVGVVRYYVAGRTVYTSAEPNETLIFEGYASDKFSGVNCSISGDLKKVN